MFPNKVKAACPQIYILRLTYKQNLFFPYWKTLFKLLFLHIVMVGSDSESEKETDKEHPVLEPTLEVLTDKEQSTPAPPEGLLSEQMEELRKTSSQQTQLLSLSEDEAMDFSTPFQCKNSGACKENKAKALPETTRLERVLSC